MELKSGTLLQGGKYRIMESIGRGGFGTTYLAEQVMAERKVCIKEFFPEEYYNRDANGCSISLGSQGSAKIMDAFKAKFIKEAKTIAKFDHSNIIHIHDVFEENNTAYYVMEYIDGESLSAVVKRRGALDEAAAVGYIRQVADALSYIHEQRIMHLDVKPGNVMLRSRDDRAILIDFGLSKHYNAESGEATSSSPVGVSHGFAPMEQYKSGGVKEFSPATDIYSLGATLYYLVTGLVPPEAADVSDEGLPALPAHLSQGVRTAIERSMADKRKARPQSIAEFLVLLEDNTPEVVAIPTPKPTPSPVSAPVSAPVDDKTSVAASAPVADERTVVGAPAPKAQPTPRSKKDPKPKRSKRGLWIMLAAFVVAAVASFVLLGGGSSEKEKVAQQQLPPNNEIWYTSSDGTIVVPNAQCKDIFGAEIESNTYNDGKGILKFKGNVTTIGSHAFSYCESLKSVTIPNSVTTIGEGAFFGCSNLTSVTIPNSVTTIGVSAFECCRSLTSVTIPNSVTTIGGEAFSGCESLNSVTIPNSVTTIGCGAFSDCLSLISVTIPNSVTTIGCGVFSDCLSLISVTIPDSVTTIEEYAFCGCSNLKEFKSKFASPDGRCLIVNGKLVAFAPAGISEYTIPNSVTTIGEGAFEYCESLTSVTIPNSVTTIGEWAFGHCKSLKSVTIPDSVTTIGECAFLGCESLKSVTIPNSVTTIGEGAFRYCKSLTSVTIPNSVTTIGMSAFNECDSLNSVTIPNSVTTIGDAAFGGCRNLKEFKGGSAFINGRCLIINGKLVASAPAGMSEYTIPDSVTTIGEWAFGHCKSLKSVTIPDSVTTIGESAFVGCESLTSVTIPDSVTSIGFGAFGYCKSLTSVTIQNSVTTIGELAFCECNNLSEETKNKIKKINPEAF